MTNFDMIAFDADDTLWHNEGLYHEAKRRFGELISVYHDPQAAKKRLDEIEIHNVSIYGYGIKSFMLSMLEAALELSNQALSGQECQALIGFGKDMLSSPVDLLPETMSILEQLAGRWDLMLLTKGDLFEQGRKIERSGVSSYFRYVEVVSDKSVSTYQELFARRQVPAERFLMVGNSLRSDILPVIQLGGRAVYVPYEGTWEHEHAHIDDTLRETCYEIESLAELPGLLDRLSAE